MPTTTAKTIPLPLAADNNDTVADITSLGNWLDAYLGGLTTAALAGLAAGAKWTGRRQYNSDLGCFQWWNGSAWINEQNLVLNAQVGTAYTLVLADANTKLITLNNAAAITLSVPTNASVAFAVGTVINIAQLGAGQVTVSAVTPGTTSIRATPGAKLRTQYSSGTLVKIGTDEWLISGDVTA
jgi:hypothetical protein